MAIEKILNTRIMLKTATLAEWNESTLGLKKGEVAIATVAATAGNGLTEPVCMIKIGEDGVKTFKELPWNFYAKASDVIAEAKSADALETFVNNVIANAGIASDEAMKELADRVTDTEDAIEVLNGAADVEGSVAKAIADAIAALNLADTYAAKEHGHEIADVEGLEDALADKVAKEDGKSLVADTEIARLAAMSDGANKVEASETNGNIKIDGVETVVYTHPAEHAISEITGLADALAGLQAKGDYAAEEHTHEMAEVNGLADALAGKETAGEAKKVQDALDAYKTANNEAVKKVADDLAAEAEAARAAEQANADAITAMKKDATIVTFKGLEEEIAKKQDIIPENTYDAYGAAAAEKERAEGVEADLQAAIDAINNTETGILKQAKDYADGKDEDIAAAKQAGDDAMAEAKAKVASVAAGDASVTVAGTATAPTVAAKLSADADNALTLVEDGLKVVIPAAAEYSIVKAADSGDYAAVYNLTKDGAIVGASINIPKDIVVKSGSVVGDEIVLVLNDEAATEIKIPVASLIEYVTSGSAAGDMVVVNVSDDHKVTATITDGTITLAKLATDVQTAIGKAHSHENADVLAGINADKVAAWDAAQANAEATAAGALATAKSELEGKITAAQTAAEKVANDNNAAMNTRVEALEGKVDTGDKKVSEYVAAAIEALSIGDYAKAADLTAAIEQHNKDKAALEAEIAKKANDADLAAIAKTGSTDDLVQGSMTLVFDCGGAGV